LRFKLPEFFRKQLPLLSPMKFHKWTSELKAGEIHPDVGEGLAKADP
jgi:hypothetical protein